MISGNELWIFLGAAVLLNVSPGPDVIYVVSRTVAQGRRAGFLSSIGVCSGALVHVAAAAFGLSVVLATSALAFMIVKYLGAAYLVYLGLRALMSRSGIELDTQGVNRRASGWRIFRDGVIIDVLNPKAAIFFMAFLPQFVKPESGYVTLQFFALGLIVIAVALIWEGLLVLLANRLTRRLRASQTFTRWLNRTLGAVLTALGLRLAFDKS
ncbi:MAG: LysE family translocator [Rhodospirillales bacterium]|nr:LysE family translocator [Rhodospirillales bacterium]